MATNVIDVAFIPNIKSALRAESDGGATITRKEIEHALKPVINDNDTVDKSDYGRARALLESDVFEQHASGVAQDYAKYFISTFQGRWAPSSFNNKP